VDEAAAAVERQAAPRGEKSSSFGLGQLVSAHLMGWMTQNVRLD
jgi:hypothetical protein